MSGPEDGEGWTSWSWLGKRVVDRPAWVTVTDCPRLGGWTAGGYSSRFWGSRSMIKVRAAAAAISGEDPPPWLAFWCLILLS